MTNPLYRLRYALLAAVLAWAGCAGCDDADEPGYTHRDPTPPEGTGKVYFGREIARPSGHMDDPSWFDRPDREATELPDRVVRALGLTPAQEVADVGAGTGYFTFRLAAQVPRGTVYAIDIERALLDTVAARAEAQGFSNIEPVLGTPIAPNLPPESIDVAMLVDTYHEVSHPREMALGLLSALRPGARLVVVEYRGEDPTLPVEPLHSMTEAQVRRELESVGFAWVESRAILPQQHFLVFERPLESGE